MYWDDLDCICFIFFSQPFKDHTWTQGSAILLDWLKYEILSLFPFFFSFRCYLKLTMNASQNFVIYCMIKIKWYFYFGCILNLIEFNKMIEMNLDKVLLNSKKIRISSKYHYGYFVQVLLREISIKQFL